MFALTVVYIIANLFVFVVDWFPSSLQDTLGTKERVVASWVGPTLGTACFAAGAAYWLWDRYALRWLGYELEPLRERTVGMTVHIEFHVSYQLSPKSFMLMTLQRHLSGFAEYLVNESKPYLAKMKDVWELLTRRRQSEEDMA